MEFNGRFKCKVENEAGSIKRVQDVIVRSMLIYYIRDPIKL